VQRARAAYPDLYRTKTQNGMRRQMSPFYFSIFLAASGSGVRYIAIPTITEALFSYRRAA
jgi:hypothetical protein